MPRLNELQSTYEPMKNSMGRNVELAVEETLVPDQRVRRSTSQIIEDKLRRLTRYRMRQDKPQSAGV
jgi:hypothetical protein